MKKRMWMIPLAICIVGAGGFGVNHELKQIAAAKVVDLLNQPQTKSEINQIIQHSGTNLASIASAVGSDVHSAGTAAANVTTRGGQKGTVSASGSTGAGGSGATVTSAGGVNGTSSSGQSVSAGTSPGSSQSTASGRAAGQSKASVASNGTSAQSGGQGGAPVFKNRQQVIAFAMSRFSESQLAQFAKLYAERGQLTTAQKNQIKAEILSRFTPAELAAMEAAFNQ